MALFCIKSSQTVAHFHMYFPSQYVCVCHVYFASCINNINMSVYNAAWIFRMVVIIYDQQLPILDIYIDTILVHAAVGCAVVHGTRLPCDGCLTPYKLHEHTTTTSLSLTG